MKEEVNMKLSKTELKTITDFRKKLRTQKKGTSSNFLSTQGTIWQTLHSLKNNLRQVRLPHQNYLQKSIYSSN